MRQLLNSCLILTFDSSNLLKKIGDKMKAIGFLMPQKYREREIGGYVVSVDQVEAITNLNFFPSLPTQIETEIESKADYTVWVN